MLLLGQATMLHLNWHTCILSVCAVLWALLICLLRFGLVARSQSAELTLSLEEEEVLLSNKCIPNEFLVGTLPPRPPTL